MTSGNPHERAARWAGGAHRAGIPLCRVSALLAAAAVLSACSSSPERRPERIEPPAVAESYGGSLIDSSEDYWGPQTAAVSPVADRRPGQAPLDSRRHADIQSSIQRQLDRSGIFAGVVALDRPDEGNEAEVIIEPALVQSGGDSVELQVRVTEKTKRRVVLDQRYRGGDRHDPLKVAIGELEEDLADRYER